MATYKKPQDDINLPDFLCDPNARKVTMFNCANSQGAIFGCVTVDGGNVPQINQVLSPLTFIAGTSPPIPTYYLITHVDPQNPAFIGNYDFPTLLNVFSCGYDCPPLIGGGCVWAQNGIGQFSNWQDCDNALQAGSCDPQPTHFCDDWNVFEIIYPGTTYTGNPLFGKTEAAVLSAIIGRTMSSPYSTQPISYPYSDPGGVWAGCGGSLSCMYSTLGTPAVGGTSIYHPLGASLDDCIACCGGINQPFNSNGTANPYYGMSTHPTPHAGWAAYLAATGQSQNSQSFELYMLSLGMDSCGLAVN